MTEVEAFVANFVRAQLAQVVQNGATMGLSPLTTISTVMQAAAATLAQVAPAEATALLRAYADCIEAGPGESPASAAASARFHSAAQAFLDVAAAARDFPAPQGRA
jgi:hypothetical protein